MQRNSRAYPGILSASILLVTGCSPLTFRTPVSSLHGSPPASWENSLTGHSGRISTGWLETFHDSDLMATVDAAMDRNQDLAAAAARMRAAKYQQLAGRARVKPDASLLTSGSVSRSENGRAPAQSSESYGLSLSTSWELDVWGRLRDLNAADEADQVATEALFRGARLSLAASTARSWCNLIAAEQQLELAHITLDSFQRNLRISERNYKGTGQGALDVQFGRTNVASAQRDLESRRLARDEAARTLEVLTGRFPAGTTRAGHELPTLPKKVPAGLPSELLDRRPDLTAARASLLASAHRAHASRKSLLPSLRLTSSAGTPVSGFSQLLNPDWLVASIGANLVQTLDTGGAQKLEARAALEQNQAAVHDYQQVALTAFREVESALDADQSLARQEDFLVAEVEQAALAERQSTRDYADGIEGSDILDVLEAQRRANNARSSLIRLRNERLLNRIDLHLALGGDFKTRGA